MRVDIKNIASYLLDKYLFILFFVGLVIIVSGLGLKKIRQTVVLDDTPCIRGMINKVSYLLSVEEG